jgi:hypothetical protein
MSLSLDLTSTIVLVTVFLFILHMYQVQRRRATDSNPAAAPTDPNRILSRPNSAATPTPGATAAGAAQAEMEAGHNSRQFQPRSPSQEPSPFSLVGLQYVTNITAGSWPPKKDVPGPGT